MLRATTDRFAEVAVILNRREVRERGRAWHWTPELIALAEVLLRHGGPDDEAVAEALWTQRHGLRQL